MFHNRRFIFGSLRFLILGGLLWGLCCWLARPVEANHPNVEPYWVFVAQADSYARSGPSADYYQTDPLTHGQQLEVYAETEDGWLGVRPPSNSFSWIPLDTVQLDGSGEIGTVREDRTVAWVGTHLGRARNWGWQVQLAKDETVTVIGRSEREGPDGPMTWLRIVPPSGEFRFIHRTQTVRTSEALVQSVAAAKQNEPVMFSRGGPLVARNQTKIDGDDPSAERNPYVDRPVQDPARIAADAGMVRESGGSILERSVSTGGEVIGSGVAGAAMPTTDSPVQQASWQQNSTRASIGEPLPPSLDVPSSSTATTQPPPREEHRPRGLLAAVAFKGTTQLEEIGNQQVERTVTGGQWVANGFRKMVGASSAAERAAAAVNPETQPFVQTRASGPGVMPVSGTQPLPAQNLSPPAPAYRPSDRLPPSDSPGFQSITSTAPKRVSVEQITRIHQEVRSADVDQLQVILSRLMAERASAEEAEVVAAAARGIARTTSDAGVATQSRGLAERADQYARLATRRDQTIRPTVLLGTLQTQGTPAVAASAANTLDSRNPAANETVAMTGQLVQVYSARPHSPPFALTDGTGRTIAYVTPSPGINLRGHLNARVTVTGNHGHETGMNTPHVIAQRADREGPSTF